MVNCIKSIPEKNLVMNNYSFKYKTFPDFDLNQ